jgi:hypothetical protein
MKLNKLREAMIRKVQGILRTMSELMRERWFILMLISAVPAMISGFISSSIYTTMKYVTIPITHQVNGSAVITNSTTPKCPETLPYVLIINTRTFLISILLAIVLFILYLIGVYGLVEKIEGVGTLGNKPRYLRDYIASFTLSLIFFLGLFDTFFNVAPYFQVGLIMLTSFFSPLNASHAVIIRASLGPYFQLILTVVAFSMSIITGYAWRITTPTSGTRWSDEVRKVMHGVRDWAFISYIVVLIFLFLLWPISSIDISYELCYLNNTFSLYVSVPSSIIRDISFNSAIIITIMTTAIYGLYFAKVLLDVINSQ